MEADWPDATVIVGNPPFLGGKLMRSNLGDDYVDALFRVYEGRVPREADFVCYWHEKARAMVEAGKVKRVGLLATQGIRGGANRRVLERMKETRRHLPGLGRRALGARRRRRARLVRRLR